ncbi:MAG: acetylornithine transaminase [Bacillus sp. (in: firmicutes)]
MSHLFPTYQRWELTPMSAEGSFITLSDGKSYLDFTCGIGVTNLGHRHPAVEEAVNQQLRKYWHTSNLFEQPLQEELADLLVDASGLESVFFSNSGAEANESAIKLAKKATGKKKIVTCLQSFHGRTYATMGATGQEKVKTGFGPMLDAFEYIPFNDIDALESAVDDDTAAFMVEIIQGEGGIHCGFQTYWQIAERITREKGALLIIDEVQTGIGRTGEMFAYQHFCLSPDIITLAKGLGNGLPIGAMLGRRGLSEYFSAGSHGSTFGGNPVSVSAAIAVIREINHSGLVKEAEKKGQYLMDQLQLAIQDMDGVKEVRGLGLMVGIELTEEASPLLKEFQKEKLLLLTAGANVIRLLPALTVTYEELDRAVGIIKEVFEHHLAVHRQ